MNKNEIYHVREVVNAQPDEDGYVIDTSQETIFVLISNDDYCCERWGYLHSDDALTDYLGAYLEEIILVDEALDTMTVEEDNYDEGGIIFVNFITNKGTFQLAVYNAHNGYYGHRIRIIRSTKALMVDTSL